LSDIRGSPVAVGWRHAATTVLVSMIIVRDKGVSRALH
jgi:hypothetical protein